MSDRDRGDDSYTGRAGQQAFIAQVLLRFGNAAVPVVDVGTDVLVFSDTAPLYARVQVKTAVVSRYADGSGYSAQFSLPLTQLGKADEPPLFFALLTRDGDAIVDVLIVPRTDLRGYWAGEHRFGSETGGSVRLHIQYRERVVCGEIDLSRFRNNWEVLPPFAAPPSPVGQAAMGNSGGT